jgi:conflict system pore-forming effector with SLATT domain
VTNGDGFGDRWVVGFSGKRQLGRPEAVGKVIQDVLRDLQKVSDQRLVGISSAAIGSDLLFVDELVRAAIPWICVLPFPQGSFFNELDFPDAEIREIARQKIQYAADCEVTGSLNDSAAVNESTWRRNRFADAGYRCLEQSDVMIMIVSEADPIKRGGTMELLQRARLGSKPLILVDPDSWEVRRENWPPDTHDPLVEHLSQVVPGTLSPAEIRLVPTPAARPIAELRSGFAREARKHVPKIRWKATAVVILDALAAIITAAVFLLVRPQLAGALDFSFSRWKPTYAFMQILEMSAFLFVTTGSLFLVWLVMRRPEIEAANYRFAAEITRSALATWKIPRVSTRLVRTLPHEFKRFGRNLALFQRLDPGRPQAIDESLAGLPRSLANDYADNRILPQIDYYRREYNKARRRAGLAETAGLILSAIAVVSAGILAFGHAEESGRALWGFAKLVAATAAPAAVSLLVIHEVKRRQTRYAETADELTRLDREIRQIDSFAELIELATALEQTLLGECFDWWVLARANAAP